MSEFRKILGKSRLRWWVMCHLPAWPIKRCVFCGKLFLRKPWWNANAFEEHCSKLCADGELVAESMRSSLSSTPHFVPASLTEIKETNFLLRSNPELRSKVEAEVRSTLPVGYSFRIDEGGIGHVGTPLYVTKPIERDTP